MKIVAIETSGQIGGIAIAENGMVLQEMRLTKGLNHGKELIPSISRCLRKLGWNLKDIQKTADAGLRSEPSGLLIAVSIGPGSYTGLRIGCTAAKVLAVAWKSTLVGVSTLEAIARNAPRRYKLICPVVDAHWAQVYAALFERENSGGINKLFGPVAIKPESLKVRLPVGAYLIGDALSRYDEIRTDKRFVIGDPQYWYPRAREIAIRGYELAVNGFRDEPYTLVPLYLRPSEAELKKV